MTVSEFLSGSKLKKIDSKILLQYVAGISASDIIAHPEKQLSEDQKNTLLQLAEKRLSGTPIEYITEQKSFYKDSFKVCEGVLIPQPDTEILVEEAIKTALKSNKKDYRILDLCTGTGCIGISVAKEIASHFEGFEVFFADLSPIAITCCKDNATALLGNIKHQIIQGDLFENLKQFQFDMLLTNPPYIPTNIISSLESDVQHEPMLALDGGNSGLEIVKRILSEMHLVLSENSYVFMEIGYDQGAQVSELFSRAGLKDINIIKDLGARDRVVKGRF